jgi:hypothetical protein
VIPRFPTEGSSGMMGRKMTTAYLAAMAIVGSIPVNVAAQTVARSFADLQLSVKTGDTVYVIDRSTRETRGRIDLLSPTSLQLAFNGGAFWGAVAGWITDALIRKREVIYRTHGQP